jgi:hypothetical protein
VLDSVGGIDDDGVDARRAVHRSGEHRVGVDVVEGDRVSGLPLLLGRTDLGPEPATEPGAFAPQPRDVGGVLEPLELQPLPQERGVRVEVPIVGIDAGGVPAVHQHLVERGAAAAHRVEHVQRPVAVSPAPDGDVEEQLGEQLVGLPGVLEDRQQIVVEPVPSR